MLGLGFHAQPGFHRLSPALVEGFIQTRAESMCLCKVRYYENVTVAASVEILTWLREVLFGSPTFCTTLISKTGKCLISGVTLLQINILFSHFSMVTIEGLYYILLYKYS